MSRGSFDRHGGGLGLRSLLGSPQSSCKETRVVGRARGVAPTSCAEKDAFLIALKYILLCMRCQLWPILATGPLLLQHLVKPQELWGAVGRAEDFRAESFRGGISQQE